EQVCSDCADKLALRELREPFLRITVPSLFGALPGTDRPCPARWMKALLVEDDQTMALLTKQVLEQEGFAVDHAATGTEAETLALVNEYDAIILDLVLPDRNGLSVL